jgi:hypothetical protein
MPHRSPTSSKNVHSRHATGGARATVALLLISAACLALTACGSSSGQSAAAAAAAARNNQAFRHQRAELLELVSCAHRHGINLPEPDAANKVNTRGVNLKGRRRKAAINDCYHKVVSKATKESEAERAREAGSKRQGEASPAGTSATSAQGTAAFAREREQLMEVVSCARRHGIHLPEPDAHNNINTRGANLRSRRNKAAMNACFHKVVSQAAREQEELARERETGPRRLGEGPPKGP